MSLADLFDETKLREYLSIAILTDALKGKRKQSIILPTHQTLSSYNKIHINPDGCVSIVLNEVELYFGKVKKGTSMENFILNGFKNVCKCSSCEKWQFKLDSKGYCKKCIIEMLLKVPDENCPICHEELSWYRTFKTKCNHYFHYKCLRKVKTEKLIYYTTDDYDGLQYEVIDGMRIKKCPMCRTHVNFDIDQSLGIN